MSLFFFSAGVASTSRLDTIKREMNSATTIHDDRKSSDLKANEENIVSPITRQMVDSIHDSHNINNNHHNNINSNNKKDNNNINVHDNKNNIFIINNNNNSKKRESAFCSMLCDNYHFCLFRLISFSGCKGPKMCDCSGILF